MHKTTIYRLLERHQWRQIVPRPTHPKKDLNAVDELQTHDIWHIITGFDTSEIGEIGLQAFYLAQLQLPLASLLIANALIAMTLWRPQFLSPLLMAISRGWEMGNNAKHWTKYRNQWEYVHDCV
ncbi:winged helix-turn-helix domain-containing protein [Nostocaceae cyanobacterium CENA357]|uniref:Winged helix-turn-helix domain-containing protein n=1 Tax=Atlanticothrix silvestris CENA357 TaxID=1725252 RepID=A0A8J7HBU0_9CYAN|nr:winged helix-turn-helix domain-containing protein [Atlanticothrix silvestris CENA357]